ncbi:MAG TPA: hypothetical protein VGR24_00290 [bacterium]|jgi:predicted RNA-binding Zn-ribbon protein involved in translation (DUF1610 family)|nr:hypothetical protein [bacterium]
MIRFMKRWLLEIGAAVAAILGLFLLFEQSDISETFWQRLADLWIWLGRQITQIVGAIRLVSISDVLGLGLILLAIVLLVKRVGQKIQESPQWSARACPDCGHALRRARRRPFDVLAWFLPLRRFHCRNCGWAGLRAKPAAHEEFAEPIASRESR